MKLLLVEASVTIRDLWDLRGYGSDKSPPVL